MPRSPKVKDQAAARKVALNAVLQRRAGVQTEAHSGGVTLLVPRRSLIPGRKRSHRVELDGMGQLVWELADGRTAVAQIVHHVARRLEEPFDVAEEALFAFLRHMSRRGLLLLMTPTPRRESRR